MISNTCIQHVITGVLHKESLVVIYYLGDGADSSGCSGIIYTNPEHASNNNANDVEDLDYFNWPGYKLHYNACMKKIRTKL